MSLHHDCVVLLTCLSLSMLEFLHPPSTSLLDCRNGSYISEYGKLLGHLHRLKVLLPPLHRQLKVIFKQITSLYLDPTKLDS